MWSPPLITFVDWGIGRKASPGPNALARVHWPGGSIHHTGTTPLTDVVPNPLRLYFSRPSFPPPRVAPTVLPSSSASGRVPSTSLLVGTEQRPRPTALIAAPPPHTLRGRKPHGHICSFRISGIRHVKHLQSRPLPPPFDLSFVRTVYVYCRGSASSATDGTPSPRS